MTTTAQPIFRGRSHFLRVSRRRRCQSIRRSFTKRLVSFRWLVAVRWRREGRPDRSVLGVYFAAAGALRFVIEFIRVDVRVIGPLSVAQLASILIAVSALR